MWQVQVALRVRKLPEMKGSGRKRALNEWRMSWVKNAVKSLGNGLLLRLKVKIVLPPPAVVTR
jgi:hypothetical protein